MARQFNYVYSVEVREPTHGTCCKHYSVLGKFELAALLEVECTDRRHEHRTGNIGGTDRVYEFGVNHLVEHQGHETGDFHAHRCRIEAGIDGMLHLAIGKVYPRHGQVCVDG